MQALDLEKRLQTAREQFQQRLALIKRDLLLGQAELSQAAPPARPGGNLWPGEAHPSRVVHGRSFQAGGGDDDDDDLTVQVRSWHHARRYPTDSAQTEQILTRTVGLFAGGAPARVVGGLLR